CCARSNTLSKQDFTPATPNHFAEAGRWSHAMSIQHIPEPYISEEEYIRRERTAEIKSEYLNGRIYAMSGATPPHNEICGNAIRELGNKLVDKKCSVYTSDQRIRVEESGL